MADRRFTSTVGSGANSLHRHYYVRCVRLGEVARVYRLLDLVAAGRQSHGPIHLLLQSALDLGFAWDSGLEGWIRPRLQPLRMLAGPYQHFKSASLGAWRNKVSGIRVARKGLRGGPSLDYAGSMELLFSSHLRERAKMLLRTHVLDELVQPWVRVPHGATRSKGGVGFERMLSKHGCKYLTMIGRPPSELLIVT